MAARSEPCRRPVTVLILAGNLFHWTSQQPAIAFLGQKYWLVMSQPSDFKLIIPFLLFIALYNGHISMAWTPTKQHPLGYGGGGEGIREEQSE